MPNRVSRFFSPPIFKDSEKTRIARMLNSSGWVSGGVILLIFISRALTNKYVIDYSLYTLPLTILFLIGMQVLIRMGHVRFAGVFSISLIWLTMTYQAYVVDGLWDVALLAHLAIIILAALILGWREGVILGVCSLIVIWYFALQVHLGVRPIKLDSAFNYARDLTAIFIITTILIYYLVNNMNRSLVDAQVELRERLRAEEKLQIQARYLTALQETTLGLVNRLELSPLLESIILRASELLGTENVALDLVLPDQTALRQEIGIGKFTPFNGKILNENQGLAGEAWKTGKTVVVKNYEQWNNKLSHLTEAGFKTAMCAPLKSGNKVIGVLAGAYTEEKEFTQDQSILLERFAALVSVAIDNARLYQDAQTEILERKIIETELRASDERFRKVFNNNKVAISIVTLEEGIFLEANEAFWKISGLSPEKALGHSALEFNFWEKPEDRSDFVKELKEKGSLLNVEVTFPTSYISLAYYELTSLKNQNCIVCMFYDITELRHAEKALKESEALFRKVFHASPVAICITTLKEGRLLDANSAYWTLTGYDSQTSIGKLAMELDMWDSIEDRTKFVKEIKEKRSILNPNYEFFVYKTDVLRHVIALYELIEIGQITCVLSMFYDVTEQKLAQEALKNAESRTRAILESIPDMLFEVSKDGVFFDYVDSSEVVPLIPPAEFIGKNISQFFPPHIVEQTLFSIERAIATEQLHAFEYQLSDAGEIKTYEARISGVTHNTAIVMVRDITQRKWIETEREKLIDELENKNSELERFTYTVSHDLKSPLITIKGFLGFLEQDAVSGNMTRLRGDIQRISDATGKMQSLLSELLNLSRVGRLVNQSQQINLNDLVKEVLEIVHGRLETNHIQVQVQENLPIVYGDHPRLVEVFQNLIDNAAKFARFHPKPLIQVGQNGYESGKPIFFVQDNGIGIDEAHHERIFGLFNKLDADSEGTGVGLALVKRIVELHGGRIWLESKVGKGATFYFTLPIQLPE